VRIGNISHGKIVCDNCGSTVGYAERYLIVPEKDGTESTEPGCETKRYCVKCALKKGYGLQRPEKKGEIVTTFFEEPINPISPTPESEEGTKEESENEQ